MRLNLILIIVILIGNTGFAQSKMLGDTTSHFIAWEPIKDSDILWKKRVWRQIEVCEKNNAPMRNDPAMPKENVLANILLSGIRAGTIKAYSDADTDFKQPLPVHTVDSMIPCDPASLSKHTRAFLNGYSKHPADTIYTDTSAVTSCVFPDQIEFYQIKEDWIFDRDKGQMIVRIIAIAPAAYSDGQVKPLFWLHYCDIRSYLDKFKVFKGKEITNMSWEEYFESRQFSSKITKIEGAQGLESNPKDKKHKKHKNHKEDEEFSEEHDMWVY